MVFRDAQFASPPELSALVHAIASPQCALQFLALHSITVALDTSSFAARRIITDVLFQANTTSTLQSLSVSSQLCSQQDLVAFLACTASLQRLRIDGCEGTLDEVLQLLVALADNTISLSQLDLSNFREAYGVETGNRLGTMLASNTSLGLLELKGCTLHGEAVCEIFTSLASNTDLSVLYIIRCTGSDWPDATFVLDCLRSNGCLDRLYLADTPLEAVGRDAAINAQLARNAENSKQLKRLKGLLKVAPTSVRLFLCGHPFSGKTTLCASLDKWNSTPECSMKYFSCIKGRVQLERTRGIHITSLEKNGVIMSLWDLAGQREYHAFHDYMFPNLSSDAVPSLFLFVWNPITVDGSTGVRKVNPADGTWMTKTAEMFEHEFRIWLKFIASKSLKSIKFKPKLLVGITRADLLVKDMSKFLIEDTFKRCQKDFEAHVELDWECVFNVDARDRDAVEDLAICVFQMSKQVFELAPRIYRACDYVRSALAGTKSMAPLLTKEEFFLLCRKKLGIEAADVRESIALSLNDSGDIIYFAKFDLVVTDTQWFCNDIMGELLYYRINNYHSQGHFKRKILETLLEDKANSASWSKSRKSMFANYRHAFTKQTRPHKYYIEGAVLLKMLVGLRLACQQDETSDIFIPTCLSDRETRQQIHPNSYFKSGTEKMRTFVGRRLKCKDVVCTFFTFGFFSFLQMSFGRTFTDIKVDVSLHENVIAFAYQGYQVFIEACRGEEVIDVLIRSPLDLDPTLEWMQGTILDLVEKICANPRGMQGVELAYEVLRPADVRDGHVAEERIPAVSVEELKDILRAYIEKEGRFQKVPYTWQPTRDWDFVDELLGIGETLRIARSCFHSLGAAAKDVLGVNTERGSSEGFASSSKIKNTYSRKGGASFRATEESEARSARDAFCSNGDEQAGCSSRPMKQEMCRSGPSGKEQGVVEELLKGLHDKVDGLHDKVDNLQSAIEGQRKEVLSSLHNLLTYVEEGDAGKLPRMYVVNTGDGRLLHRTAAAVVRGVRSMRLGLLCERKSGPHPVNGQPGLSLATLDEGSLKKALPYVKAFLKVAQLAVKVGAHVAAGVGDSIPDFTHVLALIGDSDAVPELTLPSSPAASSGPSVKYQDGQQWLYDVLSKHDCVTGTRIHEVFGLSRLRYRDSKIAAWLCDEHKCEGDPWPI